MKFKAIGAFLNGRPLAESADIDRQKNHARISCGQIFRASPFTDKTEFTVVRFIVQPSVCKVFRGREELIAPVDVL